MRVRGGLLAAVAIMAALTGIPATAAAADGEPDVVIRRTSHGIPHILARDFRSMGYGYAYAFAQDNICTIAQSYVTIRAERSRFFGPDKAWRFEGNGSNVNNLNSDFFFQRIIDDKVVEGLLAQKPPQGPRDEIREGVRGYVEGYNRYLRDTGVDRLPDPTCRGREWVRPITEIDVYRYFYKLALLASSGVAIDGIGGAQPPTPPLASSSGMSLAEQKRMVTENAERFDFSERAGSNAYGLGREATADGRGMVLGNPHFPWQGSQRFYQTHLTIPGKADVEGASLYGVPIVLIGHTRNLAWSHTVSTARRFTPFELKLVPGSPTQYFHDGQVRTMEADRVTVKVPGAGGKLENRTRTLYSSHHGPVFNSLLGLPLFPWTPVVAHALGDANAKNFRYLNHFLEANLSQSVRDLDAVLKRNQGIPWVNTIAADSKGEALYADVGAIPHVTNEKAAACNTPLGRVTLPLLGVPILDGARGACGWGNDPDARQPGTFGPRNMPSLIRNDYVTNSNDSYWLANPEQPLEGFSRIIGDERAPRSLRTRLGLKMVQERLASGRFTLRDVQDVVFNNRQYAGELFRDRLVQICESAPLMVGTTGPEDVRAACPVLRAWDLKDDLDSRGAILFRRFAAKVLPLPGPLSAVPASSPLAFERPFDVRDPVNTPSGLSSLPTTQAALADAVHELRANAIPLDARLREYQYERKGSERVPIHGGPGTLGVFNAIGAPFKGREGFPDITTGSSFVMAAHLNGTRCPESRSILTYSQSVNPESPYFADQTRLYSQKRWIDMRFCTEEILRDRALRITELGCYADSGFAKLRVRGGRRGLRIAFRRRVRLPVSVTVVRGRSGKRVIAARPSWSFTLNEAARLRNGIYAVRIAARGASGKRDIRERAFTVRNGRVRVLSGRFSTREGCRLIRRATVIRPVFGNRLGARVLLRRPARVSAVLVRDGRVVRRAKPRRLKAGLGRVRIPARGLPRGTYRLRISARRGAVSAISPALTVRRG